MIDRIGTMRELRLLENRFPKDLLNELVHFVAILDGEFVFLAMVPSIISLKPHRRYMI